MKIINQSISVLTTQTEIDFMIKRIEKIGRVCYKSEDKITKDSHKTFIQNIIKRGHESVIEHCNISVKVITNRAISHEIVRHRIASYSQESTRYCNYSNDKFGKELIFINPSENIDFRVWSTTMDIIEDRYFDLLERGANAQDARGILPNDLKTEIVMTLNLRSWRNFFKLRIDKAAHPQMRKVANMILNDFKDKIIIIFDDIKGE